MMKAGVDYLNHAPLKSRLLERSEEAVTQIMRELKEDKDDGFIELAIKIIGESKINVSEELIEIIGKNDKSVYHISILCLLLGFYDNPRTIQFLWNYYQFFEGNINPRNIGKGHFMGYGNIGREMNLIKKSPTRSNDNYN
jgi:hypothetical protein